MPKPKSLHEQYQSLTARWTVGKVLTEADVRAIERLCRDVLSLEKEIRDYAEEVKALKEG